MAGFKRIAISVTEYQADVLNTVLVAEKARTLRADTQTSDYGTAVRRLIEIIEYGTEET